MITVYVITYNEQVVLPHFIKHYRSRFPDCKIVVFDNMSTDKTISIALDNDCLVIPYDTDNKIRDDFYLEIKNNCWKTWNGDWKPWSWTKEEEINYLARYSDVSDSVKNNKINSGFTHYLKYGNKEGRKVSSSVTGITDFSCKTDWCVVVDCDEFLNINKELLETAKFNVIAARMIDMYGENNDIDSMDTGVPTPGYKKCCWKAKEVRFTNFKPGAHEANFLGDHIVYCDKEINCYHFKWLSLEYTLNRYKEFQSRLSDINKRNGWGIHYTFPEKVQIDYYNDLKKNRVKFPR